MSSADCAHPTLNVTAVPLRRSVSWSFIGNVFYAACQWGLLVAIARVGTPQAVGQFALGLAVSAPVMMLCNLQLRSVLATDASGEFSLEQYIALRVMTTVIAVVTVVAVVALFGYSGESAYVIAGIALAKGAESLSDILHGKMQFHDRMHSYALSLIMRGVVSLFIISLVLAITGSLWVAVLAMAGWWCVVFVMYDWNVVSGICRRSSEIPETLSSAEVLRSAWYERTVLLRLARHSLPLGIVMMLISLNVNIPRYVLEGVKGESELGIFAALAYVVVAGGMLIQSIGQSVSPRIARLAVAGDGAALRRFVQQLLWLGAALAVAGVAGSLLLGRPFLSLVYGEEYAAFTAEFVVLVAAGGVSFLTSFLGCALTAMHLFREQLAPFCIVAVVTLCISLLLVPPFGVAGAACAVLIGNVVNLLLMAKIYCTRIRERTKEIHP